MQQCRIRVKQGENQRLCSKSCCGNFLSCFDRSATWLLVRHQKRENARVSPVTVRLGWVLFYPRQRRGRVAKSQEIYESVLTAL